MLKTITHLIISLIGLCLFCSSDARAQGSYVYLNQGTAVAGYWVSNSGMVTPVTGSPFATGGGSSTFSDIHDNIAVSQVGNFLYVPCGESGTIAVFSINPSSGSLTPVPGSPFSTGLTSDNLAVATTPDNRILYAIENIHGALLGFRVGPDGSLASIPEPQLLFDRSPKFPRVSPDGRFLAVGLGSITSELALLAIGPDGELSAAPGFPVRISSDDGEPFATQYNPESDVLFVSFGSPSVLAFSIAPNGALTPAPGTPPGDFPGGGIDLLLSPNGQFMFGAPDALGNGILVHSLGGDGSLTPVPGSPFIVGPAMSDRTPNSFAVSADGTRLYTVNVEGSLSVFQIGSAGALSEVPGSPFLAGGVFGTAMAVFPVLRVKASFPIFDLCLSNPATGDMLQLSSQTGHFRYANCRTGVSFVGKGTVAVSSCQVRMTDSETGQKVSAAVNTCSGLGSATIGSSRLGINVLISGPVGSGCACK